MATELINLKLSELSFVTRPANQLARVALIKDGDGVPNPMLPMRHIVVRQGATKACPALMEAAARPDSDEGRTVKTFDEAMSEIDKLPRCVALRKTRTAHPSLF